MDSRELNRNLGHFKDDIWGDLSASFSLDVELFESYTKEVQMLKKEVKDELIADGVKDSEKMVLINTLERLGVYYLFTKEINEQLDQIYANYENTIMDCDLCTTALHFRIFRQHGYKISSDVFNKFKDNSGTFKETLLNDLDGILSLYEATYLMMNEEDILDHALSFTKARLKSIELEPTLSSVMAKQVKQALEKPLHRSVPRICAMKYISVYKMDSSRNEKILRLAMVDFNRLQLLHREELCNLLRWWKNLTSKTPFTRDRMVEFFLWSTSVQFEPEYSYMRTLLAKIIGWLTIVDDSYDAYGTFDEVDTFTKAINRWDSGVIDQVPQYLEPALNEIFNIHDELEKEFEKNGTSYALHYFKEELKVIVTAFGQEAEWVKNGYTPSLDEYMTCRVKSSAGILVMTSFVGVATLATTETFEWLTTNNKMVTACATIARLMNDVAGNKVEQQREHLATVLDCYMKQYNVTELEAIDEINKMIEKEWLTINEELLRTSHVPKPLIMFPSLSSW